jgi:A/G-specific adenine glycosylase
VVGALVPRQPATAARFAVAVMELGALVCTARAPRCPDCPLRRSCAWQQAGRPAYTGPVARPQRFAGTDRQVRGLLLDVLRGSAGPVSEAMLDEVWAEPVQRGRALAGLIEDGLVDPLPHGQFALPTS